MTQDQYDRLEADGFRDKWDPKLFQFLRETMPLFIGLSGKCPNLRRMLVNAEQNHYFMKANCPFWSVRICHRDSAKNEGHNWTRKHVFQSELESYADLAPWIQSVAEAADAI